MIAFILIWLLALDACHTQTLAPQPEWQLPNDEKNEIAPEHVEQPKEAAPKKLSEKEHLKLLKGQIDWMQKRIGEK